MKPSELPAVDFIKFLNARKGWHGKQYRTLCGQWLAKHQKRNEEHNTERTVAVGQGESQASSSRQTGRRAHP